MSKVWNTEHNLQPEAIGGRGSSELHLRRKEDETYCGIYVSRNPLKIVYNVLSPAPICLGCVKYCLMDFGPKS